MSELPNLLIEHMKKFRQGQDEILHEIKEVKSRLSQVEIGLANIRSDIAHQSADQARQQLSMDALAERIKTIERRLELS